MRGALFEHGSCVSWPGIIPAYAGSTFCRSCLPFRNRDHPRICGEHVVSIRLAVVHKGSSPHMRGAPRRTRLDAISRGIIPAYAGSTELAPALVPLVPGSSPHMRGARLRAGTGRPGPGIIPAYAGSTDVCATVSRLLGDHPRICGEHTPAASARRWPQGSSPHMRGALSTASTMY